MPSSIDQSMPMSWKTLLESSTKRASMYTCLGSTSTSRITCSQASRIAAGAVTITEFDSGKAIAILLIFHVMPKSPDQVAFSFAATSSAEACARWNVLVDMRRRASDASAFASALSCAADAMTAAFEREASSTSCGATKSAATGSTGSSATTPTGAGSAA